MQRDWRQAAEDRGRWLDAATSEIARAWAVLGYREGSAPATTLAEAIAQRIALGDAALDYARSVAVLKDYGEQ